MSVAPFVESRRPTHRVEKQILLYGLSAASAYIALRIQEATATDSVIVDWAEQAAGGRQLA